MIKVYNTLTRKKEIFKPIKKNKVGLYSCGPTVYNYAHIGNLRAYIFADILKRTLRYNHYNVKHIVNITDIGHLVSDADEGEDKMVKALKREGKKLNKESMKEMANFYTKSFYQDIKKLNIIPADGFPKATEHIDCMIKMVQQIQKNGYAYERSDAIYFDTHKLPNYGYLARLDIKKFCHRSRIKINHEKKNITDFALWFKAIGEKETHLMQWKSPWGKGWPGWHIECSAMSIEYLGQPFDIHTGGIDHIPVHHTNEIAQAQAAQNKPLANYWLHNEFLILDKGKMAKSGDNFITLSTLIKKNINPLAYRYLCLSAHYRSPLSFNWENLIASENALNNLYNTISYYPKPGKIIKSIEQKFLEAVNDDLDTPKVLAILWNLIKSNQANEKKMATLLEFDKVLGLGIDKIKKISLSIPDEIKKLSKEREELRQQKKWSEADQIRKKIEKLGFNIEDTCQGTTIHKI